MFRIFYEDTKSKVSNCQNRMHVREVFFLKKLFYGISKLWTKKVFMFDTEYNLSLVGKKAFLISQCVPDARKKLN